jgi:hypothetical protein
MRYYVIESSEESLYLSGAAFHGIPTTGHSRALWLYVVRTHETPSDWPESPTGRGAGHRRAPAGVGNWWVVVGGVAKARSGEHRSTGNPLAIVPEGFAVFDWP